MANGISYKRRAMDGVPWYVKAAYFMGVPALIAAGLVWAMATRWDGDLRGVRADTAYTVMKIDKVEMLLQRICANTAENMQDRNACFQ